MRLIASHTVRAISTKLSPLIRPRAIDGAVGTRFNLVVDGSILPDFTSPQGRASAELLTQWNARFAARFGTPLLSMQGRLLMLVAERVSMPQSEAERVLPIAHRTFYNMLSSLRDAELLIVETDATDGRLRRLRLGETFGLKSGDP